MSFSIRNQRNSMVMRSHHQIGMFTSFSRQAATTTEMTQESLAASDQQRGCK